MKRRSGIVMISVLLTAGSFSCRKNPLPQDLFPEETQEGKNTFGCYVDGEQFIAATTVFGLVHPITVDYFPDSSNNRFRPGSLFIQGIDARSQPVAGSIAIQKMNVFGPGIYSLTYINNCPQPYACDATFYYHTAQSTNYFADSGTLVISRLDTVNKIISGSFYFTARSANGTRKEITRGRFDKKYLR